MKTRTQKRLQALLMGGAAAVALMSASAAWAQDDRRLSFDIPQQEGAQALNQFAAQAGVQIVFPYASVRGRQAPAVQGDYTREEALRQLTLALGLEVTAEKEGVISLRDPLAQGQGGSGAAGDVEALIVTAQKREENIQDVPIAISAFSQEDLERSQVAGGPDLITQIPNFSFTKTNFSGYSIQIRGIGTQAVSATTDPAVAVSFNNTSFIRNRFFEQEFYDLERLEVLRGPQGTLYGRNATAGVVNIISAKAKFNYEAKVSADIANYSSRRVEGMLNIPLVDDTVALRVAGAWTQRDGYALNQFTGQQIDGRDLWSTRVSLRFEPTDTISANFIWEHFQEDDDRLRSGKQLCKRDQPTSVGGIAIAPTNTLALSYLSQGCEAVSLYSPDAFQTPNGYALPYYGPLGGIGLPLANSTVDPYMSETQSRDLRVIESAVEPDYKAKTDIAELQISIDLSDNLTLNSETAYSVDSLFSLQDYNRFTTRPGIFRPNALSSGSTGTVVVDSNGLFCDPQLGCSDRLLLVDLSTSESRQFSQEFRLGSDFDGPFNFSLGVNYLRHDALDKYYVFINNLTLWSAYETDRCDQKYGHPGDRGETARIGTASGIHSVLCPYIDPNPIGSLNDMGRNYFLSKNPYKLVSYALFGEVYYNITDTLKLTGGLRFTVDRKTAPQIPSWLLADPEDGPYPTTQTLFQEWKEPTGRLAIDWKPTLPFTDETLVYASYAHGYKAGGANPPPPVFSTYGTIGAAEPLPDTFDPEFVDAFEVGTKNTLLGGALTANLAAFYYDYQGYQVSEIRNRSAVNSNYDATVWGVELETDWRPLESLRISFKGGYEKTRIADGETSIDLMDRTAGHPGWVVSRPFPSVPSNCILPEYVIVADGRIRSGNFPAATTFDGDCNDAYYAHVDPVTQLPYVPNPQLIRRFGFDALQPVSAWNLTGYPGFDPLSAPNNGMGFSKDLGGNELPNAPDWTATLSVDYTKPLPNDWTMSLHSDLHWQSDSWWRVFNDLEYDRLDEFYTVNLSAIFANEERGWTVMAYVKNVLDETALTGAFLNSDDSGLTTNVFLTEPRLYGVRVTKNWTGGFGWLGEDREHDTGKPRPFELEIGASVSRFDGSAETYAPDWVTPSVASPLAIQEDDLDWGDIRDVKLTYAPASGWRASLAYQYGRTNGDGRAAAYEDIAAGRFFSIDPIGFGAGVPIDIDNYIVSTVHDAEEHGIVDFLLGKDVGLGAFGEGGKSALSAGLRYANFKSTSRVALNGTVESQVPAMWNKYSGTGATYEIYTTSLDSTRKFEGLGPSVSWESSIRLAGSDEAGHADLDWKVGAGVLFGKQTSDSNEDRYGRYYHLKNTFLVFRDTPQLVHYNDVVPRPREKNVTVPNLSLSLGLSYTVDRVKVSTGYSYDRFFDVIDGGYKDAEKFDRTIQGPFVKLSVGFGG